MSDSNDEAVFSVLNEDGRFHVVDSDDSVIVTCGDQTSAEQYADLMNRAYRRGFKAGLRIGRNV